MATNGGVWFFDLDDNGKFTVNDMDLLGLACVGLDEYGRVYTSNTTDGNVEMFNTATGENITLQYLDTSDPWLRYDGTPVLKDIKVLTTNMFDVPVAANFEMTIEGPAECSSKVVPKSSGTRPWLTVRSPFASG